MLITSSIFIDFFILLVTAVYVLHIYISNKYKYWKKRGVYFPKPKPFVGNFLDVILLKKHSSEWIKDLYDQIDKDFFGVYVFDDAYFVAKDPNLIKNILVKNFSHFVNRNIASPEHSPCIAHMLFFQKGLPWKTGRSKITVALTSGKMKSMFPLLLESAENLVNFLEKNNQDVWEAKELFAKYATDVISKCFFGINSHSFENFDSKFTILRRKVFGFSFRNIFAQTIYFFKPSWVQRFKIEFVDKEVMEYFSEVFMASLKARETKNSRYSDLIDIMNELKKTKEVRVDGTDDVIFCGAALQFFFAGFETTSSAIAFTLYEFAVNVDIQKAAREEVRTVIEKYEGISNEAVNDLPYLDMCLNETLRKYPVLPFLERNCTEDFPVPNSDVVIEKGTAVLIPTLGLHLDKNLFPDPHKYDPERFRNKINTTNGLSYIPFGDGPRNCLGERFGRMAAKLALVSIINNFEVTKCSTTPIPIIIEPKCLLIESKGGLPLRFTRLH
ncbi:unnamed protein product [Psylliodes chrysocephalus]|uniref:Cytochrome P450 n=1 Tax=Psylliodes chrysocephalus TaxID=3402493 RepID=A0A9P0DAU9_9CUCU|nr:unnamed protein product [Psylliodes chrysocephala]